MSNSKLLIDEQPLQVLPSLACAIGLNEAMVLQQLHWRLRYSKKQVNGLFWVFDKYVATRTFPILVTRYG